MITIAIDCRKIHDGGIGTYLFNLLKCWSKSKTNAKFILFCYPDDKKHLNLMADSSTFINHEYGKYSIRELYSFRHHLLKNKADLFFTPHYTLPFNLPCKSIAVIHDLIHLKFPVKYGFAGRTYAKTIINHACKSSEFIITDSESSRNDLKDFLPKWSFKYKVIGCGVDRDIFKPLPENVISQFRNEQSLPEKYIFYAGALKKHKNPKAFLEVASALKTNIVICSNDKEIFKNYLKSDKSAGNYLTLKNAVNANEMAKYYNAAEMLLFPSFYEGFGLPPLEAMACGTPVACSNAASLPEVVGDSAITFAPQNYDEMIESVKSVLYDDKVRKILKQKGLTRADVFSWQRSADEIFDIFTKVLKT